MHRKTGFLFDLDGVIIDSETEYSRIWHEINLLYPTGVPDFERAIKGCTLDNILETNFPPEVRDDVTRELYARAEGMKFDYCPGAAGFLSSVRDAGIPCALVTSSNSVKMDRLYAQHPRLRDVFSAEVIADMVKRSKPDPEGYLLAAEMLGIDPNDCVVFEDSLQGVKAGRAAGAYVVGITSTLGTDKIVPHADMAAENLGNVSLEQLLEKLKR